MEATLGQDGEDCLANRLGSTPVLRIRTGYSNEQDVGAGTYAFPKLERVTGKEAPSNSAVGSQLSTAEPVIQG